MLRLFITVFSSVVSALSSKTIVFRINLCSHTSRFSRLADFQLDPLMSITGAVINFESHTNYIVQEKGERAPTICSFLFVLLCFGYTRLLVVIQFATLIAIVSNNKIIPCSPFHHYVCRSLLFLG